jgi:hypothetical protein
MDIKNKGYTSISELARILKKSKRSIRNFVRKANEKCDFKLIYQHKAEGKIWVRVPVLIELFPELVLNTRAGITYRIAELASEAERLASELRIIESMMSVVDIDEQDEL